MREEMKIKMYDRCRGRAESYTIFWAKAFRNIYVYREYNILSYCILLLWRFEWSASAVRRYGGAAMRRRKSLGKGERKADIADATYTTNGTMHERKEPRTRNHIFFIAS